ncbi:MAG: tetratricopeptide repeat protein [Ignavibacteriaceae bacterium]|nr:tetratricopeptide repeat protein [Ignavibacteriaceae bacterium]
MSRKIYHLSFLIISLLFIYSSASGQSIDIGKKFLKNESFSKAEQDFKSLATQNNDPEAWYYLGETYFEKENFDSAKIAYQNGIKSKSDFGLNYAGLAKVLYNEKNIPEADKNIAEAMKIADEKNVKILQAVADAYINGGKDLSIKAKDIIDQAIAANKKSKKKDKMNFILLGNMYNVENNGSAAVENYKKAIDIDSSAEAFVSIGKIFEIIRNYGEAELSYQQAMKVEPDYSVAYKGLAELMFTEHKYSEAIDNWKKYIALSENTPENLKRLINYVYLSKDYKSAIELINEFLQNDSRNSYMLHMLAYSYTQLNDVNNGIPAFNKYFSVAKDSEIVESDYEYYSKLLVTAKQDSLAIIQLQKAISMDTSKTAELSGNLAGEYFKLKKWDNVISSYNTKIKLTGGLSPKEYFDLGRAYYLDSNWVQADSAFSKITQAQPELIIGYVWRARSNAQLDISSEKGLAKPFYEKVVSIGEKDSLKNKADLLDAYHYLGYYYYLQKDNATAKSYFQRALMLSPDDPVALDAVKNIGHEKEHKKTK